MLGGSDQKKEHHIIKHRGACLVDRDQMKETLYN